MSSTATEPAPPIPPPVQPRDDLGPLPRIARPFVDWVARVRVTVHTKLLAGFLVIAVLLLSMGVLCIVVLDRVNRQVVTLTALNRQTDQAREMIYEVTAQSHYRAMALLTGEQSWTGKIDQAKDLFVQNLAELRTYAIPDRTAFFDDLQAANDRFTLMSNQVTALDEAGEQAQSISMHIDFEHAQSHVLENALNSLIADSQQRATAETAAFLSHRRFLTLAVATFSGITLLGALLLGAILSWSLIRPVRKLLTTFFSDVRGFTAAAERMEPEQLVDELNEYLTEMTEIVFKHGGTLDKYVGDAVMVFFGDPLPQEDHARRAVLMGFEMQERMAELQQRWMGRYQHSFEIGIGIATGWVTVGDIGSPARSDYTVLGNEVNLAARVADRAASGQILATERTMTDVADVAVGHPIDEILLKGISRPIKIFELQPRPA